jgi:hypothetical protein
VIEGEGFGKSPHHTDRHQHSKPSTTLAMELDGGFAEVVAIRCGTWKFTFHVDPNSAPGLLRDLAATVEAIVAASKRAAA